MEEESKLTKLILSPNLSGVYVSKADLINIAADCGYAIQLQERKRMLKEIFALVRGVDDFISVMDAFSKFFDYKESQYKKISNEYPSSSETVNRFLEKIKSVRAEIEMAKEEATLLA